MKHITLIIAAMILGSFLLAPSTLGQDTAAPKKSLKVQKQAQREKIVYTCPMHPEVVSDRPGKCPQCKMDLEKKVVKAAPKLKTARVVYTCPMHPDVKSDKPGKCPICKMDLEKAK